MNFHLDLGVKKVEAEITRRFMSSWRRTLLLQMSGMAFRFACMSMRVAMPKRLPITARLSLAFAIHAATP